MPAGLTELSTSELEALLRALRAGAVRGPLDAVALADANLSELANRSNMLVGLELSAAVAVVEAVLAERRDTDEPRLDLVWTGPEHKGSAARDTAVVVRELFSKATRDVLVAGFAFDHGKDILEPLHLAMRDRGVSAEIFLNIGRAPTGRSVDAHVALTLTDFWRDNWPFGDPRPTIYYDPRTVDPRSTISLHAKCIVVDERLTLVTSANFTQRGHERNLEVGVLIDSTSFARHLVHQWRAGALRRSFVQAP